MIITKTGNTQKDLRKALGDRSTCTKALHVMQTWIGYGGDTGKKEQRTSHWYTLPPCMLLQLLRHLGLGGGGATDAEIKQLD